MVSATVLQAAGETTNNLILYNTVMGFAAGIALLLFLPFASHAAGASDYVRNAWAWCFGMLGAMQVVLGYHVNTEWPLLGSGNLIFGEPSFIFGALLIAAAVIIHRTPIEGAGTAMASHFESKSWGERLSGLTDVDNIPDELLVALRPLTYVGAFCGPMLILLAIGGAFFGEIVFRPPPSEFPTGLLAGTGIEIAYMLVAYGVLGLGSMILPAGMHNKKWLRPAGGLLALGGLMILFLSLVSFLGHASMAAGVPPGGIPW